MTQLHRSNRNCHNELVSAVIAVHDKGVNRHSTVNLIVSSYSTGHS